MGKRPLSGRSRNQGEESQPLAHSARRAGALLDDEAICSPGASIPSRQSGIRPALRSVESSSTAAAEAANAVQRLQTLRNPSLRAALCKLVAAAVDVAHVIDDGIESSEPETNGPARSPAAATAPTSDELLIVSEAASLMKCSEAACYARIERGQVPGVVHFGRRVYVYRDRLLEALRRKAT